MSLTLWAQTIVQGLLMGGIYALIAAGLTFIFGVMRIINFAHGEFLMVAMFVAYLLATWMKLPPAVTPLVAVPLLFLLGLLTFRSFLKPLVHASELSKVLCTVGIAFFLQNLALLLSGGDFFNLPVEVGMATFSFRGVVVVQTELAAFVAAVGVSLGFYWFLRSTELGRHIRATTENRQAAMLVGVNVERVDLLAFGMGTACVGLAGPLLLLRGTAVSADVGLSFIITAFVVVVLGGMGNFFGALLGGLTIGLAEAVGKVLLPGSLGSISGLAVMILVLLLRPEGLMGKLGSGRD
ncbi:MAG: branched-chain amino acid ABC transporter permease [Nitrospinota bacterium]